MDYHYKKEFFRDWYARNKGKITKKEILQVIRTTSANNLQIWMLEKEPAPMKDGQTDTGDRDWLPLRCILRLCSHYDLKLSDFIEGAEDIKPKPRKKAQENAEITELQLKLAAAKQKLAEAKLDYEREINAIHAKYREREDNIRKGYDETIQKLLSRVPEQQQKEWPHMPVNDDAIYGQTDGKKG